jgi:hypothetical protein
MPGMHCMQVAVMPVRVVWGDNQIGMLFVTEMALSLFLMLDVVLSFNTGAVCSYLFQSKG